MTEQDFNVAFWKAARRVPRCALAFATAYFLLWLQAYLTSGWIWIAVLVGLLAVTDLGVPVARFTMGVLVLMVLLPPPVTTALGDWIRTLS